MSRSVSLTTPVAMVLYFEDIRLDVNAFSVARVGGEIRLRPVEFRLLAWMMQNAGRPIPRSELLGAVWGSAPPIKERTIYVCIGRLRKALTSRGGRDPIRTLRGEGFVFGEALTETQAASHWDPGAPSLQYDPSKALIVEAGASVLRASSIEIDRRSHVVRRLGREIHIGPRPFAVLELFLLNVGKVFNRKEIAAAVWSDEKIDLRTVDAAVARVRKAINGGVLADPIRSVNGQGYKFSEFFEERHQEWPERKRKKQRLVPRVADQ